MQDLAAAAAGGVHSPTLGSRESAGDTVFLNGRNSKLRIILRVTFRCGRYGGGPGRFQAVHDAADREGVGSSRRKRLHHGIRRIHQVRELLGTVFQQSPFIGRCPAHRIPLKGQRGLRGAVESQPRRRGGSRRNGVRIFLIPTGNHYQQSQQTIDPNCFHDIFHIRASPRSAGPCPSDRSRRRLR